MGDKLIDTQPTDGWVEWGKYVLKAIETLNAKIKVLERRIERLIEKETERQITLLEVDARLRSVERLLKIIGGMFSAIAIWAIIELIKTILHLT